MNNGDVRWWGGTAEVGLTLGSIEYVKTYEQWEELFFKILRCQTLNTAPGTPYDIQQEEADKRFLTALNATNKKHREALKKLGDI